MHRRLRIFMSNRRAFYSSWLFLVLLCLSLLAEFLCNDRPLLVAFEGSLYCPALIHYPETTFGGDMPIEADFKDPYLRDLVINKGGWILFAPIRYSFKTVNLRERAPSPPSRENLLGTDDQGRDDLARWLYGMRLSLIFGLSLATFSILLGLAAGAIQGYFGGWIDLMGQRLVELWSSLPVLFILIVLSGFVQPNVFWLFSII